MASPDTPFRDELIATARALTRPGKGLLAADESHGTLGKRFDGIKLENSEENRRAYRDMLFSAPCLEKFISGVILYEETTHQKASDGTNFVAYLQQRGIIPGIKLDKGLVDLPNAVRGEQATQGFDDLHKRCAEFYRLGCRFAKWRNVYKIQNGTVSELLVQENARALARYATVCQSQGLVPIVEPEVLMDGDHDMETCQRVCERVNAAVMKALSDYGIVWEGMLLKPNMVMPGADCKRKNEYKAADIARATVEMLSRTLPAAVPGVMFLSGGISEVESSEYLNAINSVQGVSHPWYLGFSYARALQSTCLKAWAGKPESVEAGQRVLLHRAEMNSKATVGTWQREADDKTSESLYVKGYTY